MGNACLTINEYERDFANSYRDAQSKESQKFEQVLSLSDEKFEIMIKNAKGAGIIAAVVHYLVLTEGRSDDLHQFLNRILTTFGKESPRIYLKFSHAERDEVLYKKILSIFLSERIVDEKIIRSKIGAGLLRRLDRDHYPHPYVIDVFEIAKKLDVHHDVISQFPVKYDLDHEAYKTAYDFVQKFGHKNYFDPCTEATHISVNMRNQFDALTKSGQTELLRMLMFSTRPGYLSPTISDKTKWFTRNEEFLVYGMIFENKVDIPKYPVLHHLVRGCRDDRDKLIRLYIEYGGDIACVDNTGKYAYEYAGRTMENSLYMRLVPT